MKNNNIMKYLFKKQYEMILIRLYKYRFYEMYENYN